MSDELKPAGETLDVQALLYVCDALEHGEAAPGEDEVTSEQSQPVALAQVRPFGIVDLDTGSYLGIRMEDVTSDNMASYKLDAERGVIVRSVDKGSPAEEASLREKDVILEYDGIPVISSTQLKRLVQETPPGRRAEQRCSCSPGSSSCSDGGGCELTLLDRDATDLDVLQGGSTGAGHRPFEAQQQKTLAADACNPELAVGAGHGGSRYAQEIRI